MAINPQKLKGRLKKPEAQESFGGLSDALAKLPTMAQDMADTIIKNHLKEIVQEVEDAAQELVKRVPEIEKDIRKEASEHIKKVALKGDKGEKGDKGDTPPAPTDGKDGKDGKNAPIPVKGKDFFTPRDVEEMLQELFAIVIQKPAILRDTLSSLKGEERLDVSAIKGIEEIKSEFTQKIANLRAAKGGSGGGMGNIVNKTLSGDGSTTVFTLDSKVAGNGKAAWVFYQGQYLVPGTGFTIDGTTLTTLFTPINGTFIDVTYVRT